MVTFTDRANLCINKAAKRLFQLMDTKKTNLAIAVDVTSSAELLNLAEVLGPYICVLKTHIDIVEDFSPTLIEKLKLLATKHNFMIFEDRKFAEIGNTAMLQYEKGIYHIAEWSEITNAHALPGTGLIQGLKKVGLELGNGLLLIGEMSSAGNLIDKNYTQLTTKMAIDNKDFVIGFITQHKLIDDASFINMTPGIQLTHGTDNLGQQYVTPRDAIIKNGTDIIIVGRGIYQAADPRLEAAKYQQAGWDAYLARR